MILYSYFRSSASYRTRIALNLKGLTYEYRAVHLLNGEQGSEDYRKLNSSRQVPTLIHEGKTIAQSMAIIEYLDTVKASPRLFPQDPLRKALVTQACEIVNSGIQPLHNTSVMKELTERFNATDEAKQAWCAFWLKRGHESLEGFLSQHAGRYSFGDEVSAADCFLMPHFFAADRFHAPIDAFPTLKKIRASLEALEAFKKAAPMAQPDAPKP